MINRMETYRKVYPQDIKRIIDQLTYAGELNQSTLESANNLYYEIKTKNFEIVKMFIFINLFLLMAGYYLEGAITVAITLYFLMLPKFVFASLLRRFVPLFVYGEETEGVVVEQVDSIGFPKIWEVWFDYRRDGKFVRTKMKRIHWCLHQKVNTKGTIRPAYYFKDKKDSAIIALDEISSVFDFKKRDY